MRVAVFVDAGYLFAQGCCAVSGQGTPEPRESITLNMDAAIALLKNTAIQRSGGKELLRIYWYDAAPASGPSAIQVQLARMDNVKLRLGQLNAERQQKGVDSMIVHDLTELARNRAMSDALLLTGDEDIRLGVQNAQSQGVRVHLLGITSTARRDRQSETLQQEADTVKFIAKDQVAGFLSIKADTPAPAKKAPAPAPAKKVSAPAPAKPVHDFFGEAAKLVLKSLRTDLKLEAAAKVVREGKEVPGYAVKILNELLSGLLLRGATASERKAARDTLAAKLRETSDAS